MVTKTNYHMLREFDKEFKPKRFGILSGEEVKKVMDFFQIKERTNIDLQNLRDMVVMYYALKKDKTMDQSDVMSGIVCVIDNEKWNRGMEV